MSMVAHSFSLPRVPLEVREPTRALTWFLAPLPAPPPCLCLFLPVGLAGAWREGHAFHPGPRKPAPHNLLFHGGHSQQLLPWIGGTWVSPLKPIPCLLRLWHRCPLHHFQVRPQLPRSAGKAEMRRGRISKQGVSIESPKQAVIPASCISELQGLERQLVQQPPVCVSIHLSFCRNSEARLLGSELGFPTF